MIRVNLIQYLVRPICFFFNEIFYSILFYLDGFIFDDDYDKNETDYYDNKYLRILHKGRNVPDGKSEEERNYRILLNPFY